jgi:hypothetical protein
MKNLESSIQRILNEEYIEESIDKVKDLYNTTIDFKTLKKGDRLAIGIEHIKNDGKQITKEEMFFVDSVEITPSSRKGFLYDMIKVNLTGKPAVYTLFKTQKALVVLTLGDKRLVISGIRKK